MLVSMIANHSASIQLISHVQLLIHQVIFKRMFFVSYFDQTNMLLISPANQFKLYMLRDFQTISIESNLTFTILAMSFILSNLNVLL